MHYSHDRSGFTLVEVMVAVTILALSLLALAASVESAIRLVSDDVYELRAASLVSQRVERTFSTQCQLILDGSDSASGVMSWCGIQPAGNSMAFALRSSSRSHLGLRNESYLFARMCK